MLLYFRIRNALYARAFRLIFGRFFRSYGRRTSLIMPLGIEGIGNIALGDDVYVGYKTLLAAVAHTGASDCSLEIGSGTNIGSFNHIYATRRIVIGRNVLTAGNVYISDNLHGYADIALPVKQQPITQLAAVMIGEGTWIGQNVCVLGATVGRNCVLGANAVVTRDIPDYCVAVGAPAVVVKRYDAHSGAWRSTNAAGEFT